MYESPTNAVAYLSFTSSSNSYRFWLCTRGLTQNSRTIRYERWRLPHPLSQKTYEMAFGPIEMSVGHVDQDLSGKSIVLRHDLPPSLGSLSLFEDTSSKSPEAEEVSEIYGTDTFRLPRIQVLDGLAGRAVNLKHLSVSFLSDAMDCFKFPAGALPNLQSLAIISQEHPSPTNRFESQKDFTGRRYSGYKTTETANHGAMEL